MFCTRLRKDLLLVARRVTLLITGRNEVVAKVMFLLMSVILSTGGALPQCMLGYCHSHKKEAPLRPRRTPQGGTPPPRRTPPAKETPQRRWHPPAKETPPEGDPQGGTPLPRRPPKEGSTPLPRPTPKGEIEGDQIQAHTQGGN